MVIENATYKRRRLQQALFSAGAVSSAMEKGTRILSAGKQCAMLPSRHRERSAFALKLS